MKVSNSLILALMVSSVFVAQSSFADMSNEEAIESIQSESEELGLDSIGEPPVRRDHRGGVRSGPSRPVVRGNGGHRPAPSRPIVRDHRRGGGHPSGGVVVRPTYPSRPGVYRPGRPGYRPPVTVHRRVGRWNRWNRHVVVSRDYGYFQWNNLVAATCTAVDSYGVPYTVTDDRDYGQSDHSFMYELEVSALSYCHTASGGDYGCTLSGPCTPLYRRY